MTKLMLVEDDQSLREIYSIRLTAEGYTIVSAGDGEEALALAVREKPDLILSDVMMPKISGFDMLDILRSTPETKNIKVIMMTALSSEDQRERGEGLGADRYLVKSQVGIEDVVNVVHEVLGDKAGADGQDKPAAAQPVAAEQPAAAQPAAPQAPAMQPATQPAVEQPAAQPAPAQPAPQAQPAPASVAQTPTEPASQSPAQPTAQPSAEPAPQPPAQPAQPAAEPPAANPTPNATPAQ